MVETRCVNYIPSKVYELLMSILLLLVDHSFLYFFALCFELSLRVCALTINKWTFLTTQNILK